MLIDWQAVFIDRDGTIRGTGTLFIPRRALHFGRDKWKEVEPDFIVSDINEAVKWILARKS